MVRSANSVVGALAVAAASAATAGCGAPVLPEPRRTAAEFAAAAQRGDANAVHALLAREAQRSYGKGGVQRLLSDARGEIRQKASAVLSPGAAVHVEATVPYLDGERAVLELEGGAFRVSAAAGLPAAARTPAQALSELRIALAGRSYGALMRVLSTKTQSAVDGEVRSLVDGLERPDTLDVKIHGEAAEVDVPGGHKVWLKREAGVWRIHDFD